MEPVEILELFDKRATVIKPGLERITRAFDIIGWPARRTPCFVVAGTNGKGSTCGFLFRLLAAAGIRVGMFSSPHLIEFRERFSISDADVSNAILVNHIKNIKKMLPETLWAELTFFEINTLLAARVFDEFQTDVNVWEVGLGGRLDCVNVFDADVAIITSIGLDHQEYLGTTHGQIAQEKAGIMRPGKPIVWGGVGSSEREAHDTILDCAKKIGANVILSKKHEIGPPSKLLAHYPSFLLNNFHTAMTALDVFADSGACSKLSRGSLSKAVADFDKPQLPWPVTLNGRFELITVQKGDVRQDLLIDVCHNPHGARALNHALEETGVVPFGSKRPCLISVLSDKDASGIWAEIRGKISEVIRFKIPSSRSWHEQDHRIEGPMMESFQSAWDLALSRKSWQTQSPWLIFGSVAAVGDVLSYFRSDGWSVVRKVRD